MARCAPEGERVREEASSVTESRVQGGGREGESSAVVSRVAGHTDRGREKTEGKAGLVGDMAKIFAVTAHGLCDTPYHHH